MIPQEEAVDPYRPPAVEILPPENAGGGEGEGPLKDPRLRGWIAGIAIVLNCLAIVAQIFQPGHMRWSEGLEGIASLTALIAAVSYLPWIYRCAGNALIIQRDPTSTSAGWAVGYYFVPIANLWLPCKVMREIARKTFLYHPSRNLDAIIFVWWIPYVARGVIGRFSEGILGAFIVIAANLVAGAAICYIILRISQAQAAFRWSDAPESQRPNMRALSGPRQIHPGLPPKRVPSQPEENEHTPGWDRVPRPRRPEKPADY